MTSGRRGLEAYTRAMSATQDNCWILTDGRAGNLRQARALAGALVEAPAREFTLATRAPWRWLAPRHLPGSDRAWGTEFTQALRSPPRLVIGCGRQAALATRLLRERGSRAVQILDPRIDSRHWDAVVVPAHDRLRGANVYTLSGSLNPVDDAWLADARMQWPELGRLPGPRVLVLLGGPVRAAPIDAAWWQIVLDNLQSWRAQAGGSLMLACSPRTPQWLVESARAAWPDWQGARWCGTADGDNPFPGMLAWADVIVASPDSVNMISEACATPAPVCVPGIDRCTGRQRVFLDNLLELGRIRPLTDQAPPGPAKPLRELELVCTRLRRDLQLPPRQA